MQNGCLRWWWWWVKQVVDGARRLSPVRAASTFLLFKHKPLGRILDDLSLASLLERDLSLFDGLLQCLIGVQYVPLDQLQWSRPMGQPFIQIVGKPGLFQLSLLLIIGWIVNIFQDVLLNQLRSRWSALNFVLQKIARLGTLQPVLVLIERWRSIGRYRVWRGRGRRTIKIQNHIRKQTKKLLSCLRGMIPWSTRTSMVRLDESFIFNDSLFLFMQLVMDALSTTDCGESWFPPTPPPVGLVDDWCCEKGCAHDDDDEDIEAGVLWSICIWLPFSHPPPPPPSSSLTAKPLLEALNPPLWLWLVTWCCCCCCWLRWWCWWLGVCMKWYSSDDDIGTIEQQPQLHSSLTRDLDKGGGRKTLTTTLHSFRFSNLHTHTDRQEERENKLLKKNNNNRPKQNHKKLFNRRRPPLPMMMLMAMSWTACLLADLLVFHLAQKTRSRRGRRARTLPPPPPPPYGFHSTIIISSPFCNTYQRACTLQPASQLTLIHSHTHPQHKHKCKIRWIKPGTISPRECLDPWVSSAHSHWATAKTIIVRSLVGMAPTSTNGWMGEMLSRRFLCFFKERVLT